MKTSNKVNSIRMIVKPKITNDELFNEVATSTKKATMYNIKFGPFGKPIFKLDMCVMKYPLGRFDKITIEHEYSDFVKSMNKTIKQALGEDATKFVEIKQDELGVKVHPDMKEKVEPFTKFDVVDILVEFNNCWHMAGKIYVSFNLKDIKESAEKPPQKDTPFLFTDIE